MADLIPDNPRYLTAADVKAAWKVLRKQLLADVKKELPNLVKARDLRRLRARADELASRPRPGGPHVGQYVGPMAPPSPGYGGRVDGADDAVLAKLSRLNQLTTSDDLELAMSAKAQLAKLAKDHNLIP